MALLDKENLVERMAKRQKFRLNHVGTKLNDTKLKEFMTLVEKRKQTPSELIRELIWARFAGTKKASKPASNWVRSSELGCSW